MQIKVIGSIVDLFHLENTILTRQANAVFKNAKELKRSNDETRNASRLDIGLVEASDDGKEVRNLLNELGYQVGVARTARYLNSEIPVYKGDYFAWQNIYRIPMP